MRFLYCWRCDAEVPMLDEDEFAQIFPMYEHAVRRAKRAALRGLTTEQAIDESFGEVLAVYSAMTGRTDHAAHAIKEHRLSKVGPPCGACGKPLRKPDAPQCAACGAPR